MIESFYITLTILAFSILILQFFIKKYVAQTLILMIAAVLFTTLAISSANVEIVYCTSEECYTQSMIYVENMWLFASFGFISIILFVIKAIESLTKLKDGDDEED